ncbi:uncharacterized protein EV420DRAFT_1644146 [Desarmillaria tabescens]|uniref:Uncharacterized protein n=1 Tax=Armillaria tabescens TaxID=1929756 RepID=A0AA39KEM2_ARMTA|nr:uncharacterized protein EV420DRAFT_1644146 [Desarmillaria tabescens]KAK0457393.1 hypothetical protein EV420DRAFT_1644146 [Desarmillaria tabescens]
MSLESSGMYLSPDESYNETMELALLHGGIGIYTGIFFVTLWNISNLSPSDQPRCALNRSIPFAETFDFLRWGAQIERLSVGIGATVVISTVIADCAMIWRCWMVWGRRWLVVPFPILCLASGLSFKIFDITGDSPSWDPFDNPVVIYISCIIATTLWCTVLIVLRTLIVIRAQRREGGGLGEYRHVIEVFIESSALYTLTLIIYIILKAIYNWTSGYFDILAEITTGIAPTLLAGRVAAGHARRDDTWQGSIVSSLRFEAHPQAGSQTTSQESSMADDILNNDLEAQTEQIYELEESGTEKRIDGLIKR